MVELFAVSLAGIPSSGALPIMGFSSYAGFMFRYSRKPITGLLITMLLLSFVAHAHARGPWRAGESNTRGWQLMTPAERIEHQSRIRSIKTYEECQAYQLSHHQLMEERARRRNISLPGRGRNFCEHLKPAQGSR